jgi:hypothetical protein
MQLIYFEQEVNGGYGLALQVISICAILVQFVFILQLTASTNHHICILLQCYLYFKIIIVLNR